MKTSMPSPKKNPIFVNKSHILLFGAFVVMILLFIYYYTHDSLPSSLLWLGIVLVLTQGFLHLFIKHKMQEPIHYITEILQSFRKRQLARIVLPESAGYIKPFQPLVVALNQLSDKTRLQMGSLLDQKNENEIILDSLNEGVLAISRNLKITYANSKVAQMFGKDKQELINQTLADITLPQEIFNKCKKLASKALSSKTEEYEQIVLGEESKTYLDIVAIAKKRGQGVLIVIQDKTSDYKVLEMGKNFVANASHELRTPITIIQGFAETLVDMPHLSTKMVQEISAKIVKTSHRLNNIIDTLLTQIEVENSSSNRFQLNNLVSIVENCVEYIRTVDPEVIIEVKKQREEDFILADSALLELAINNLFENAIKYSINTPYISIQLVSEEAKIVLIIQDRGIGIPKQAISHIFDRFFTLDKTRSKKHKGVGLGLSLVKTIVEKHQGSITVVSEENQGTLFTLTFPLIVSKISN